MLSKVAQHGAHIFYRWPGAWGLRAVFTGRYVGEPQDPLALRPPPPTEAQEQTTLEELAAAQSGPLVPQAPVDPGAQMDISKDWALNVPRAEDGTEATVAIADHAGGAGAPPAAAQELSDGGGAPTAAVAQD
jgi:hypothetical protein